MSTSYNLENSTNKRLAFYLIIIGLFFAIDSFLENAIVYKLWPLLLLNLGVGFIGIFGTLSAFAKRLPRSPLVSRVRSK